MQKCRQCGSETKNEESFCRNCCINNTRHNLANLTNHDKFKTILQLLKNIKVKLMSFIPSYDNFNLMLNFLRLNVISLNITWFILLLLALVSNFVGFIAFFIFIIAIYILAVINRGGISSVERFLFSFFKITFSEEELELKDIEKPYEGKSPLGKYLEKLLSEIEEYK